MKDEPFSLRINTDSEDSQNVHKITILGIISAKIRKTPSRAIALEANLSHHQFLSRVVCQPTLPFPEVELTPWQAAALGSPSPYPLQSSASGHQCLPDQ